MKHRKAATDAALLTLARFSTESALNPTDPRTMVVAVAATVEGYVDEVLRALVSTTGYQGHPFLAEMYRGLEDQIFQSWPERFRWLNAGFGVSMAGRRAANDLNALIQLRNACVHGNGSLTERQVRELSALVALEKDLERALNVTVVRRRLEFGRETSKRSIEIARQFVSAFDEELSSRHPHLRV